MTLQDRIDEYEKRVITTKEKYYKTVSGEEAERLVELEKFEKLLEEMPDDELLEYDRLAEKEFFMWRGRLAATTKEKAHRFLRIFGPIKELK